MSSKEFITGLLELYQNKSCLWQITCPEYTNKNLKNVSYKELVAYCQKFYKEADKTFVQQKLQNLRTAFRKELKKVEDSKRSGAGIDDIYVPKLWYFDLLLFTKNDELPRQSIDCREKSFPTNTANMDLESDRKECNKNEEQDSEEERQETQTTTYSEGRSLTEIPRSNMKNFLEEKFKVDLLLHFKKTKDLVEILKSERSIQIQRVLKNSKWFVEQIISSMTVTELITTIFPNTSFRTKVKLINKLAIHLNDSDKAHEYFEAIDQQYGTYLASKLLPSCRPDYIVNFLNTRHFKPTPKQALLIIKRYPEYSEEIVDILMRFDNASEEYMNVFDHLKLNNINLLLELNCKHMLNLRMGWRVTDRFVHLHEDDVIGDPKKYYKTFHNKQIAKSLHHKFNVLYINLFPPDLDEFSDDYHTIISVLRDLPKRMRQGSFLIDNYAKIYGTSFWNSSHVSLQILDLLTVHERVRVVETEKKPSHILDANWKSYLTTDKSFPLLKKEISLTSAAGTRAVLVECLVNTCKINLDDVALLNVCNYVLNTHRNDHIKVRKSFLHAIKNNYDLAHYSDQLWKYINELIGIFELNNESFEYVVEFKKMYLRFRLLHNLPVEDELLQWVRGDNSDLIFGTNSQQQLHCFNVLADIISREKKGDDLSKWNNTLLHSICQWNNTNKEKISLLRFENAMQLLKQQFATNEYSYAEVRILTALIQEECKQSGGRTMLNIYLGLREKYGNRDILLWVLQHHPSLIEENINDVIQLFTEYFFGSYREHYLFKYIRNYPSILEKAVKYLLNPEKECKKQCVIIALSFMQKSEDFLKMTENYYPTERQADAKTDAGRELYALQEIVTRCLKNLDPPSVTMPSILRFCKGDYLKLIRTALYSVCDNANENKLISFLSQLIDAAVSIRKHALHLTFRTLDKNQVYSLIKHFMEKEKNDSIRKFIFKGCFNFFIKNPDDFTWELVTLNINAVDINDREALEILLQFDKVPKQYRSNYVVLTWNVLNTVPDPNDTLTCNLNQLIGNISTDMIPTLPQDFYDKVINGYFLKEDCSHITFMSSTVNKFVCKYILYSNSDVEKKERLNAISLIIKDFVLKNGKKPDNCNHVIDILKEFCMPFLKDNYQDKEIFEEFVGLWNDLFKPHELFDEYLHLKLVALYMESLEATDLGCRLGELCDSLVDIYGEVIVGMLCEKINFFGCYFFNNDQENCYDMIEGLISNDASTVRLVLAILLLSCNSPDGKRAKRRYNEIMEKLDLVENITIKLYLCSIYSGNLALHYVNY
ncbi:hypothetical protein FQR65_LT08198 [Abscondita terminalis]|nr:hypothetical protein FQR65_LT08198 [Abscondita terminalis]